MTPRKKDLQVTCYVDDNKVDCETWSEEYYDDLKAKGLSDQEIDKFINDLFYNSND